MSRSPKTPAVIERIYDPEPEGCVRALALLLQKQIGKGVAPSDPGDRKGRSNEFPAKGSKPSR